MSWHSKRSTLQHLSAVNRRLRSPLACGEGDLPLLKAVRGAILAAKPPESGECRLNQIERALEDRSRSGSGGSPTVETPEGAISASQRSGIGRMSVEIARVQGGSVIGYC